MASLFDYVTSGQHAGQKAPTGYKFRTSSTGRDVYSPVNELNRAQKLQRNPGSMGGGRSNLDAQRGFSNQGIRGLMASNRQPGLFGSQPMVPSDRQPGLGDTVLPEEEDQFAFQDRNIPLNFAEDVTRMATDLTPNINLPNLPGLGGIMNLASSISNNQADHRYINSLLGRASPEKNMAFFNKAIYDANQPNRFENPSIMAMGDTSRGSSLGQAMKYFERAGITKQDMDKFMDPNSKFYGNEAYLSAMAGADGAEDFTTGMSFIKNAKASANLARDLAAQQMTQGAYAQPSDRQPGLFEGEAMIPSDRQPGLFVSESAMIPSDRQPGLFESEPGLIPDEDAEFYEYPDERYLGMLNRRDPAAVYEGVYPSPITDTMYDDDLSPDAIRGGFTDNRLYNEMPIKVPGRPLHGRQMYKPRDTIGITEMGGGFNALPLLDPEEEEFIHPRLR